MPYIIDIINVLLFWSNNIEEQDSKRAIAAFLNHSRLDIGALRTSAREMVNCPKIRIHFDCIPEYLHKNSKVRESCFLSRLLIEQLELKNVSEESKNELAVILCWLHLEGTISNKKLPTEVSEEVMYNSS